MISKKDRIGNLAKKFRPIDILKIEDDKKTYVLSFHPTSNTFKIRLDTINEYIISISYGHFIKRPKLSNKRWPDRLLSLAIEEWDKLSSGKKESFFDKIPINSLVI